MKVLILFLAVLLISCSKDPVSIDRTNNPEITVELLFIHDSIKVYRFYDGGRAHYFTKDQTITSQHEGRNSSYEEVIKNE
jgi:hypothetical protein